MNDHALRKLALTVQHLMEFSEDLLRSFQNTTVDVSSLHMARVTLEEVRSLLSPPVDAAIEVRR